ncbi:ComEC/Rec2 family competence protein [Streptomyces sp. NPDC047999]|uniref:ComEC/Rec2 family competence protein n=1 Tax=Streptomyces sp. NPDC047999 TaxID=3365497 RepID=UPI003720D881
MLKIHFLNVGHGDCTIVELHSGRLMMIDINNSKKLPEQDEEALAAERGVSLYDFRHRTRLIEGEFRSWEDYYKSLLVDPAEYFKRNFPGKSLFRYIQTHPDMDHMSGLHRLFWDERVDLVNFWDVDHDKTFEEPDFNHGPFDYADWEAYENLRKGKGPGGNTHTVLNKLKGWTGSYWTDDRIEILSPTQELISDCATSGSYNDCSYVLKLTHAGRTVILPGDAESAAWKSILDDPGEDAIKCDILKAPHHGRASGYHEEAVDAMLPDVVICSVGKKPGTDASGEYKSHGAKVLSTRYNGTITVKIWDDGDIWVENHKGERIHTIT